MFDITQFREDILTPVVDLLQIRDKYYPELLIFTCAVESAGGTYVKQIKGPALGIFQIEPNTFSDLWHNYIIRKPDVINLLSINLNINRYPSPYEIISNLSLAAALCALFYKWKGAQVAENTDIALWAVYKKFYNTEKGKAEEAASIKAYHKFIKA